MHGLAGTVDCFDGDKCSYREAHCGKRGDHDTHDWRPKVTALGAGSPMLHCSGYTIPEKEVGA